MAWVDDLRVLIKEARTNCDTPNSCPAVVYAMMSPLFKKKIKAAKLESRLIGIALSKVVAEYLKKDSGREDGAGAGVGTAQINLWPECQRDRIIGIDRAAVLVPSRAEFVPLVPNKISRDEVIEAGQYLIAHGKDSINRGQLLLDLAKDMQDLTAVA